MGRREQHQNHEHGIHQLQVLPEPILASFSTIPAECLCDQKRWCLLDKMHKLEKLTPENKSGVYV